MLISVVAGGVSCMGGTGEGSAQAFRIEWTSRHEILLQMMQMRLLRVGGWTEKEWMD